MAVRIIALLFDRLASERNVRSCTLMIAMAEKTMMSVNWYSLALHRPQSGVEGRWLVRLEARDGSVARACSSHHDVRPTG